jgi:hypothetical protein
LWGAEYFPNVIFLSIMNPTVRGIPYHKHG